MQNFHTYHVIGLMSGSSLDGLDIAYCKIETGSNYFFEILCAENFPFSPELLQWLKQTRSNTNENYKTQSAAFGKYCGEKVMEFCLKNKIPHVDFIASHGHTILHAPEKGITLQLGDGKSISDSAQKNVISNFRQADIDAGGQGAPLVPIADEFLFPSWHACLNIGGITNISYRIKEERIGFDICAANQLLNYFANQWGFAFDTGGHIAESGKVDPALFSLLNANAYFQKPFPKSLDNSWIKNNLINKIEESDISVPDKLATATEHIAFQIAAVIKEQIQTQNILRSEYKLLITGGGVYNSFLLKRIKNLSGIHIQLPADNLIQFKEALAMCLMGVLCREKKPNFIPSVTGAKYAACGGEIILYSEHEYGFVF
ncbi:MAG: anhydro-N-acetylmuramic acid kinase [Chitinophagales bacterium]|nr:anhydro-N-acetylmuramic acid kinase [Chitinophagales bacterium]